MRRQIWIVFIIAGLFVSVCAGTELVAFGAVIYPVGANGVPIPTSNVTISILTPETPPIDITGTWLPVPEQPVVISVNGIQSQPAVSLVVDGSEPLTTSRYPGICTNFGDGAGTLPDFTLSGYTLTPHDSGGRAVVKVNGLTFILPQDSNLNGIPDIYENQYGGALVREADIDTGPDAQSSIGDGIANIDEYRGFRVRGSFVRGDPTRKDLFIHLEEDLQCMATAGTFTGQTSTVSLATFFTNQDGSWDYNALFQNVNTLSTDLNVHRVDDVEWVTNFASYDKTWNVILSGPDQAESATIDRWINMNAIYPLGQTDNSARKLVKGVRIIQCLDLSAVSPLGKADKNPPDLFVKDNGNAVLFIHRIVKSMLNAIKAGGSRKIQHYTYENQSWALKSTINAPTTPSNPSVTDPSVKALMKIALAWYLAHEALEHSFDVTGTTESTYGYHHAEGSGTNVDIKITNKVDKSTSGFNKFYIPKYHGISDERQMRVLSAQ